MDEMTKASKRFSWFVMLSLLIDAAGVVFGILAALEFDKVTNGNEIPKYLMMGATIIIGIVLLISTIVAFAAMRGGEVKSAILALGKHTKIQLLAPLTCLILGIIGILQPLFNNKPNEVNLLLLMILIVAYVIVLFVSGFNARGLKAFRKDKESYGYISVTSFIIVGALIAYSVIAVIAMTKIPSQESSNLVGYLEVFAVLFSVGDAIAFLSLGIMAQIVKKYAPKVTMADADAAKLDDLGRSIDNLSNKIAANDTKGAAPQKEAAKAAEKDPVTEIRRYKQLLDEGIITQEEFNKKKKELLG